MSNPNPGQVPGADRKKPPREPWIIRTYAGFGHAQQANRRFHENLKQGQRGLSIAFDLPTQNGFDCDAPIARGEVGKAGVSISHWQDMDALFEGIDLGAINTSMTINATAPWLLALYLVIAEKRGVPWDKLRGTTQNDLLKEYVARGTSIFQPEVSLRLSTELIRFCVEQVPNWNPINCCGYHYMESGAGPAEEIGDAFGNALMILDALRPRLEPAAFEQTVRRISFFINSGIELVPEICKVRAYFKLWRELCATEYGIADVAFRAGCQVRSLTLTEQQPELNIVRIAYEALPVVLSADARVNALQLPGFREAMGLPDQAEQLLSLRTQQILMHETELARYGDIFEGSRVIESLTEEIATRARAIAMELRQAGYKRAIEIISGQLTRRLTERQAMLEAGEIVQVGVNAFTGEIGLVSGEPVHEDAAAQAAAESARIKDLERWRSQREPAAVGSAREMLERASGTGSDIMPPTLELARAGGTVGEWTQSLERSTRGRYTPPVLDSAGAVQLFRVPRAHRPIRIALGKAGLDGHVNAIKLLAHACRQAGMEVIIAGFKQTAAQLVEVALQEDAEILGVSSMAGAHMTIAAEIMDLLRQRNAEHVSLIMGGIIPERDRAALTQLGVQAIFTPRDSMLHDILSQLLAMAGTQEGR
jgi:(2R)-ethylmalonyl-CoA mutase